MKKTSQATRYTKKHRLLDSVISDLIVYLEREYTDPKMVGLALRLRARLAKLRDVKQWTSMNSDDPTGYRYGLGEPYRKPGAAPLSDLVQSQHFCRCRLNGTGQPALQSSAGPA